MNQITSLKCSIIKKWNLSLHYSNIAGWRVQAGQYHCARSALKGSSPSWGFMIMIIILWSRICLESFSPLQLFAYASSQESFYRIDDGALARDSMKPPPKRCWTRATWSHLRCTGAPCLRRWAGPAGSEQSPTSTWQGLCTPPQGYLSM